MFWIALVATAQVAAPPSKKYTGDARSLFTADDYPAGAFARGEQGTVIARLLVDQTGRVEACSIEQSSGSKELDLTTCEILRRRAKFRPATGPGGKPVYEVFRTPPITWSFGPVGLPVVSPDVEIDLSREPPGISLPFDLTVEYVVSADGKIVSCKASRAVSDSATALVPIACDPSHLPPTPAIRNNAGDLVDAMNSATLRFTLAK